MALKRENLNCTLDKIEIENDTDIILKISLSDTTSVGDPSCQAKIKLTKPNECVIIDDNIDEFILETYKPKTRDEFMESLYELGEFFDNTYNPDFYLWAQDMLFKETFKILDIEEPRIEDGQYISEVKVGYVSASNKIDTETLNIGYDYDIDKDNLTVNGMMLDSRPIYMQNETIICDEFAKKIDDFVNLQELEERFYDYGIER